MERTISRRSLVAGTALAAAGIAGASVAGAKAQADEGSYLPAAWDDEADVIVVGYGGAGASAAITAATEGLGSVIVLEAAPEGQEGGNSRACGQNLLIPQDVDAAIEYQKALNDVYTLSDDPQTEDELYRAWATELCKNKEWLESLGAEVTDTTMNSHEFPEMPGNELGATCYLVDGTAGEEAVWNVLKAQEEPLGIDVRYGTRALKLVVEPATKEVRGVEAEQDDGTTLFFKANKGVVLACGGFENDLDLMKAYTPIGTRWDSLLGTPYNRGDGFRMVGQVGADLWHMNNFTGLTWTYRVCGEDNPFSWQGFLGSEDYIYVGPDGRRFINEKKFNTSRHGKLNINGTFQYPHSNDPSWTIFGQEAFDAGNLFSPSVMGWACLFEEFAAEDNQGFVDAGIIKKADTVEELAELIGYDPATLADTVRRWNEGCANGVDEEFHRNEPLNETMAMLSSQGTVSEEDQQAAEEAASQGFELAPIEGPFYAVRMHCSIGNTQGGPVRGANGEVMDVFGEPVPRLYAAGEFGCIYAYMYNGGGNLSEALSSSRIAVRSAMALEPWE